MPSNCSSRSVLTFGDRKKAGLSKVAAAVVIVIVLAAAGVGAIFGPTKTTTVTQTVTQSATVTTTVTSLQTTTVTSLPTPTANNTIDLRANSRVVLAVVGPADRLYEFFIGTLINPTIQVKAGTRLQIFFDGGIYQARAIHSFVITSAKPPFLFPVSQSDVTPAFPGASTDDPTDPQQEQFTLTFTADKPGTYYYICAFENHALIGMYGQFIVEE